MPGEPLDPHDLTRSVSPHGPAAAPSHGGAPAGYRPGDPIGPYTLLELIGEGGFGVVFLAERREPMLQRVAVKVIRPGMDSRAVVARFEQERQALALMDHPNVARVFDGGVSERGVPYFVMEHVRGEPITDFCDHRLFSVRRRLELFMVVCDAVQHAHHKGIIHRDIKPSNILVAEAEGGPVVKVIDFGVAKAITQEQWGNSVFTAEGVVIGTPEYMSPEQVSGAADIDTRSDVYSLGVLLYQLLTGHLPFEPEALRRAGLLEIQRIIREQSPPRPSTKLGQARRERSAHIARSRAASPERLSAELRRELDWIPLMALRKERERRYSSAAAMAEDLRRYLDGRPLIAAPDSRSYLARKFVKRHRAGVLASAAVLLTLAGGLAAALWQAREAARQRDEAVAARAAEKTRADELRQVADFQDRMLSQVEAATAGAQLTEDVNRRFAAAIASEGDNAEDRSRRADAFRQEWLRVNATDAALALIDATILSPASKAIDREFKDQPLVDARLRQALANRYHKLGLLDEALPLQERAIETRRRLLGPDDPDTLESWSALSDLLLSRGQLVGAEAAARQSLAGLRRRAGDRDPRTITAIGNLGSLLQQAGQNIEAEKLLREAVDRSAAVYGPEHIETLRSTVNLGAFLGIQRADGAEAVLRDGLAKCRRVLGDDAIETINTENALGSLLFAQARYAEAEQLLLDVLRGARAAYGEMHPVTLAYLGNAASVLQAQGKFTDAEPLFRESLDKSRLILGADHPLTLRALHNTSVMDDSLGHAEAAEAGYRAALDARQRVLGPDHPDTLETRVALGKHYRLAGDFAQAGPLLVEAEAAYARTLGDRRIETITARNELALLCIAQKQMEEAGRWLQAVLAARRGVLGEDHRDTLESLGNLANVLRAQGRHAEAAAICAGGEAAARRGFTGRDEPRLGMFLLTMGRAKADTGFDPARFADAEKNLLESFDILHRTRGPAHRETQSCIRGLVSFYSAWDRADPGKGFDTKRAEWSAKLTPAPAPPR